MIICVVRNAEVKSNTGMLRIIDSLIEKSNIITLTRSRRAIQSDFKWKKEKLNYQGYFYTNFELQLQAEFGQGIKNISNLFKYQIALFKWFIANRKDYDAIHAFDLDTGLVALIISLLFNKKLVYHIADFYVDSRSGIPKRFKKTVRSLEYFVISKANAIIICTEERMEQIKGSSPQKLYVIHNSPVTEPESITPNKNKNPDKLVIGYIGGLSKIRFVKEILEVVSENDDFILNIAGYGELKDEVVNFSEKFQNINYFGIVDYDQSLNLYNQSDVIVAIYDPSHPNHKYSAPNKVYEAMMLGKPIMVANKTGVDKMVSRDKTGVVIDYNKDSFKKELENLYNNISLLAEYSQNGKTMYDVYSWNKMKKKVQKVYEDIYNT